MAELKNKDGYADGRYTCRSDAGQIASNRKKIPSFENIVETLVKVRAGGGGYYNYDLFGRGASYNHDSNPKVTDL